MNYGKLAINAVLAGIWAATAILVTANGQLTKELWWAAAAVALRTTVGLLADAFGSGVPVDK
jgi:hypothetical protein